MKIILAIGNVKAERAIEEKIPSHCKVVGIAPYKEAIIPRLQDNPTADVLLIRDNLKGQTKVLELIYQIKRDYPKCRIVLLTKTREVGDPFLEAVISCGVWDIILDYKVDMEVIIDYLLNPRQFKDIEKYQRKKIVDEYAVHESSSKQSEPNLPTPASPKTNATIPTPLPQSSSQERPNLPSQTLGGDSDDEVLVMVDDPITPIAPPQAPIAPPQAPIAPPQAPIAPPQAPIAPPQATFNKPKPPMGKPKTPISPSPTEISSNPIGDQPIQPKILPSDDMKAVKKPFVKKRRAWNDEIKSSPVVMSLVGFKSGVGVTQVALNLAIDLARKNNRVLYVELSDNQLPFTYLYQLGSINSGLEHALLATYNDTADASSFIQRMQHLKKQTQDKGLQKMYQHYPDNLDFLAFTHFFNMMEKQDYHPEQLRQLLNELLLKEGYQYIILDVNMHAHPTLVTQAFKSSKYIMPVMTQDMSSVAQTAHSLKELSKSGVSLDKKIYLIVNRYDTNCFSDRSILRWLNNELMPIKAMSVWTIPEAANLFNKANDMSLPVLLSTTSKPLTLAFESFHHYLKTM